MMSAHRCKNRRARNGPYTDQQVMGSGTWGKMDDQFRARDASHMNKFDGAGYQQRRKEVTIQLKLKKIYLFVNVKITQN